MYAESDLPVLESRTSSTESDVPLPETPADDEPQGYPADDPREYGGYPPGDPLGYPFPYMDKTPHAFSAYEVQDVEEHDTPKACTHLISPNPNLFLTAFLRYRNRTVRRWCMLAGTFGNLDHL